MTQPVEGAFQRYNDGRLSAVKVCAIYIHEYHPHHQPVVLVSLHQEQRKSKQLLTTQLSWGLEYTRGGVEMFVRGMLTF